MKAEQKWISAYFIELENTRAPGRAFLTMDVWGWPAEEIYFESMLLILKRCSIKRESKSAAKHPDASL